MAVREAEAEGLFAIQPAGQALTMALPAVEVQLLLKPTNREVTAEQTRAVVVEADLTTTQITKVEMAARASSLSVIKLPHRLIALRVEILPMPVAILSTRFWPAELLPPALI
jgi:hypothetical protein